MYALADQVATADTDYGVVVLNQDSGEYWNLNPTGALVLRSVLESGGIDVAVSAMTKEYAVDTDTAEADARALLSDLLSAGVLVRVPAAEAS